MLIPRKKTFKNTRLLKKRLIISVQFSKHLSPSLQSRCQMRWFTGSCQKSFLRVLPCQKFSSEIHQRHLINQNVLRFCCCFKEFLHRFPTQVSRHPLWTIALPTRGRQNHAIYSLNSGRKHKVSMKLSRQQEDAVASKTLFCCSNSNQWSRSD